MDILPGTGSPVLSFTGSPVLRFSRSPPPTLVKLQLLRGTSKGGYPTRSQELNPP